MRIILNNPARSPVGLYYDWCWLCALSLARGPVCFFPLSLFLAFSLFPHSRSINRLANREKIWLPSGLVTKERTLESEQTFLRYRREKARERERREDEGELSGCEKERERKERVYVSFAYTFLAPSFSSTSSTIVHPRATTAHLIQLLCSALKSYIYFSFLLAPGPHLLVNSCSSSISHSLLAGLL